MAQQLQSNIINDQLPDGWVETTLGEIISNWFCKIKNSYRQPLASNVRSTMKGYYPYYGAASAIDFINTYKLEGYHLLIAEDGTVTSNGISPMLQLVDWKFNVSNHAHILQWNQKWGTKFLFYILSSINITPYITWAVQPKLTKENLLKINFLFPQDPEEQVAIASLLSSFDDKIELLREENKTLEQIGQTIFQEWFGKYGIDDELPEGWRVYKFKDLVKQLKPGTNYQPDRLENGIPFINGRNVKNGFLDLSDTTYISTEEYERVHKTWKPEENDILITRIGTLGNVGIVLKENLPIAVHYNSIVVKESILSYQSLYFLMTSEYFQQKYHINKKQAVQEFVTIETVEDIDLCLPETNLINQQLFIDLFEKLRNNYRQIQSLSKTRDELLPKLMRGEVRVSNFNNLLN